MLKNIDDFPFLVKRIPYLSNNIPLKIFYSSLKIEILQIGRTTTTYDAFKVSSKLLINGLMKQGDKPKEIKKTLNKMFSQHFQNPPKVF